MRLPAAVLAATVIVIALAAPALARSAAPTSGCNQTAPAALTTVQLPGHPFSIVSTQDGCWLFVSITSTDPKSNGVAVLRREAGKITVQRVYPIEGYEWWSTTHPLWPGPAGMVMTHDDHLLIMANFSDCVIHVLDVKEMISGEADPAAGRLKDSCSEGSIYVNVTGDDRFLFVSDEFTEAISVFNLEKARAGNFDSSALVSTIPVGVSPIALTFSPDEQWLYTTSEVAPAYWNWPRACPPGFSFLNRNHEGAVIVVSMRRALIDPANAVVARVPAGCGPVRLAITEDGGSLWASVRDGDEVLEFDTSKLLDDPLHARIGSVPVGAAPVGIAVLPDGKRLVVTNSHRIGEAVSNTSSTVTVIDTEKVRAGAPAVVGTIPAGVFPRETSMSPDGRTLFLGNYLSDTLEVIDLENLPRIITAATTK